MKLAAALFLALAACGSSPPSGQPDAPAATDDAPSADAAVDAGVSVDAPTPRFPAGCAQLPCTLRVSVASSGTQGNVTSSDLPTVSGDGAIVAFVATSSNLVAGDTNGKQDTFVRDLVTETTTRISIGSAGQANQGSVPGWITPDGRHVAFSSAASNLVTGDTNGAEDVFVIDRPTMMLDRVNVNTQGVQATVGPSGSGSHGTSISGDGRYVLFTSYATNLVPADTNAEIDLFLRDRNAGTTVRIGGSDQPNDATIEGVLSTDGSVVAFWSYASNVIANDTNGAADAFLRNTETGEITLISQATDGTRGNQGSYTPSLSANERLVAFSSYASNLVADDTNNKTDIFLRDLDAGTTTLISRGVGGVPANGISENPKLSADGRYILFTSKASNLVADDTNNADDAFLFDRTTNTTTRVSIGHEGQQGNGGVYFASLSAAGNAVVFTSVATNLVPDDTNGQSDTFICYLGAPAVID